MAKTMKGITLNERYHLEEEIGRGGFAAVWRALDRRLQREVAVKLLDPFLVERDEGVGRQFLREARAVAGLRHGNVVHIYDAGTAGSRFYLVMEFLPGGDLGQKLAGRGPYTPAQARRLLAPIAAALAAAHKQKLIHRDVKPANILFAGDGRPVLTDFGLVKFIEQSMALSVSLRLSDNRILGTPGYMAPEQIDEELGDVSPATDVFALAVILWEMLTGRAAFRGRTPHAVHYQTIHAGRDKLLARLPETTPPATRQILNQALAVAPGRRPQQIEDFWTALAATEPTPSLTSVPLQPAPAPDNPAGIEWVEIPAGDFLCGDENVEHHILRPFRIGKFPVTNAQYQLFIDANPDYPVPKHWDQQQRRHPPSLADHPVVYVNWEDANAFCRWANCRLPTDFEWERAARGPEGRTYPWGEDWVNGKYCNTKEAGYGDTTPVDYFAAGVSPEGVWDLSGNVWEWTSGRVVRGGSWLYNRANARSAYRANTTPDARDIQFGFRVVCVARRPPSHHDH
jgi:serine/threonine protein kinase